MSQKQMCIGISLRGHGYHLAAWRHPDVPADASSRIDHYVRTAQAAERGKCDLIFFADGLGIRDDQLDYATRYERAREFVDVVKGLWDSWDADAFPYDKTSGQFYNECKMHVLDHRGTY